MNKVLVKVNRYSVLMSNLINVRPFVGLLICHCNYLLSTVISSFLGLITWAAVERLKEASG